MRATDQFSNNFMRDGILMEFRKKFEKGYNLTKLMNEMEETFKIPMINDEEYNKVHKDVIKLYREVSDSRNLQVII